LTGWGWAGAELTASWSPDSKKLLFTDTNLKAWVVDVTTGTQKLVGNDPWMVPQRTMNPVWSPDSKWVAYAAHLQFPPELTRWLLGAGPVPAQELDEGAGAKSTSPGGAVKRYSSA